MVGFGPAGNGGAFGTGMAGPEGSLLVALGPTPLPGGGAPLGLSVGW